MTVRYCRSTDWVEVDGCYTQNGKPMLAITRETVDYVKLEGEGTFLLSDLRKALDMIAWEDQA